MDEMEFSINVNEQEQSFSQIFFLPPPGAEFTSVTLHQKVRKTLIFLSAAKAPLGCKKEWCSDSILSGNCCCS